LVSIAVAVLVLALKVTAWRLTGSVALFSDAAESVVNVLAAVIAFGVIRFARQPADEGHPFGHGKAEYFSAGFEGAMIVAAACFIFWEASGRLWDPQPLVSLELGAVISIVATALNGAAAMWLVRVGRKHASPALEADGMHLWSDVLTTLGALVGLAIAWATGWWVLDPLFAILVALNILRMGVGIVGSSVAGLMDAALPPEDRGRLEGLLQANMHGAIEAHDLRTRRASERIFVEFHLVVPGNMSVRVSHDICDRLEDVIEAEFPNALVTIHVEPESEAHGDLDSVDGPGPLTNTG